MKRFGDALKNKNSPFIIGLHITYILLEKAYIFTSSVLKLITTHYILYIVYNTVKKKKK